MRIDEALLSRLERLSMIHIDENKRQSMQTELTEILGFVENIASIKVLQDCFKEDLKTPLREDVPEDAAIAQDVLKNAPCVEDSFFIVPKIIE